ncbi:MAG: type IV secretion system DNA-binding domain-containing protein [Nitrosopumilus sp.]|nr:type IV secretion system DNA-binding domain-containing protein [Nitrosopumilus sp.]
MTKYWKLANRKKQKGTLGDTDRFLPGPKNLAACSVRVPIQSDDKAAADAAGGLASAETRSFEIWWDSDEKQLRIVLVTSRDDLASLKQSFRNMYPNVVFDDLDHTEPTWFSRDMECQVFDVSTYHGHFATVFDQTKACQLIRQIAGSIQLADKAWIQFVFANRPFSQILTRHIHHMDRKYREISHDKHLSNADLILYPDRKPHAHPELGHDFTNNYRGLQKHATLKMQSSQVMMGIRGIVQSDRDIDLNFDEIEALPVETVHSGHEHLTKYRYPSKKFWDREPKKTKIKIKGEKGVIPRMDIFQLRLLPEPGRLVNRAQDRYINKGIFGYRDREPLPFLILNQTEMPLFVHLPDPTTPNIETTRGVMMPSKASAKVGACLGFAQSCDGPGPGRGFEWGGMDASKDLGGAVLSPADLATHLYAVGASGSGKTSLIRLIAKHLEAWNANGSMPNAFIYVDPKGDDSHKFARQHDPDTMDLVHYLDPQETKFSINPLELPDHALWEREEVVSRYVGYFMKTIEEWYQQSQSYVQMERIFRALLFYIYRKHDAPTFLDIHDIILRLQDGGTDAMPGLVKTFGEPDREMRQALESIATLRSEAFTPLLNRVEQFATDPVLKRMFSVRKGTVDFWKLIEPGHQTIVRISPLNMPQHVQPLAMQAFILKLWFTIQERANRVQNEKERTQVVLALDEFQIVKDLQVLQLMLEQARSLGLGLILSHQTTEQISDKQLGIISGNSGTQLVGRVNGRDASRISQIWDPQFSKQLHIQLASQEYFHWTVREKAPPGQEQPPPAQFWLSPPPELILTEGAYEEFIREQLAMYGSGTPGSAVADSKKERSRWLANISVELPDKITWGIICQLHDGPLRQSDIVDGMRVSNRTQVAPVLQRMEANGLLSRSGDGRSAPYELTDECIKRYLDIDVSSIGTAPDVAEVAAKAVSEYMNRGSFVAVASQKVVKGRDRTDLVAYDYEKDEAISVEIESESEVQSHPEHVRHNMIKWANLGFSRCHVWSKSPRIREIRDSLDEDEKERVTIVIIPSS